MTSTTPVQPVEALVFDVGGVLVAHENRLIHERLAARCRVGTSIEQIATRLRDRKWDRGEVRIKELHAELARDLGYDGDWDAFLDDWCCHFTPDSSMIGFVEALARDNRVLLFSNTNKVHWDYLERHCPIGGFERYLSHEIGLSKPDVEAYAFVAQAAGIAPATSLFFDDLAVNVEGARRAGFRAEVFLGRARLEEVLAASGVALPR